MTSLASCFQGLDTRETVYVKCRLEGMTQVASARAGGWPDPAREASKIEKRPAVQNAIVKATELFAEEVEFSRKEAHDMLTSAYYNAATAGEQVAAVRELIKLHGVAAPVKVEHEHEHTHQVQLEHMALDDLMKLAGSEDLTLEGEFIIIDESKQLETDGQSDEGTGEV